MHKKSFFFISSFILAAALTFLSCSKNISADVDMNQLKADILKNTADNVCLASYQNMVDKSQQLLSAVNTLNTSTTDPNLNTCRDTWKDIRVTWEQSEAWLFGPVSTDNIDPRIDTWPVDFNALDSILATTNVLDEAYVNSLDDALKGFHPIEYLLWGENGNKLAASFTEREKEYLLALATNLNTLCKSVRDSWQNGYATQLSNAGNGSSAYPTRTAAFTEIVNGMAGICDEMANGKMKNPFDLQDPSLEESPFSKNSITDFTNNMNGIMAMYQGKLNTDGKGIEDLVRQYNLSLDNDIKNAHAAAIASLNAITVPFGEAILTQQTQVQNAMIKINDLAAVLENKLAPFVLQYGG